MSQYSIINFHNYITRPGSDLEGHACVPALLVDLGPFLEEPDYTSVGWFLDWVSVQSSVCPSVHPYLVISIGKVNLLDSHSYHSVGFSDNTNNVQL